MADESIVHAIGSELAAEAPPNWQRLDAVFAMTATTEYGFVIYFTPEQSLSMSPPEPVLRLVRSARAAAARTDDGPWWRLLLTYTETGDLTTEYDYGEDPFPADQLFAPDAYRADLAMFPRSRIPVWLAAYITHDERRRRTPQRAAVQARDDREGRVWAVLAEGEFPPLSELWSRWAALAACFVAARSPWGPRMLPWTGTFEGAAHSGSTLRILPGDRAVLSGGVWNAPTLDAAYNGSAQMPNLFTGAPDWVADPILDSRDRSGLLSFCYWWEAGSWYRGQSPPAAECSPAIPGVWTTETVTAIAIQLFPKSEPGALGDLLTAVERGSASRENVTAAFREGENRDIDGALYELSVAGRTAPDFRPIEAEEAISRVRDYAIGRRLDTTGYPLSRLRVERIGCGWLVGPPTANTDLDTPIALFCVADDGVLDVTWSSDTVATVARFEESFAARTNRPRREADRHG